MATIFIGIPTFNRPTLVQDAILSVQAQRYRDFRAVVSDNCSDGDTAEQIERFVTGLNDARFSFHRQAENVGEYGQGRFFFEQARGSELFLVLHDDDVMLPDLLEVGVAALREDAAAAFFVANAYGMDQDGRRSEVLTRRHLRGRGRIGAREGSFDVLTRHMECGFAPISGTLFRRAALEQSGFVDADMTGNFPFESNIFLRLGEAGAQARFSARELLGVRYHAVGGLRSRDASFNDVYVRILNIRLRAWRWDPELIGGCIRLWERRRFTGRLERRRRVVLSNYRRAWALIQLRAGNLPAAQRALTAALRDNLHSVKAWALAPMMMIAPSVLRALVRLRSVR